MDTRCDVLVIGAGPAGSAAARALARRGRHVLLCEKGPLPRHRLCGEFVSPEAVSDLSALGLDIGAVDGMLLAGACVASGGRAAASPFEPPAYGVSRRVLDAWLARAAEAAGAELRLVTRVVLLRGDLEHGFEVELEGAGAGRVQARVVIGAYGKQAPLFAGRGRGSGWVAVEAHLEQVGEVPRRVELHPFAGGYVGVAPVGQGRVNVCALVRSEVLRGLGPRSGSAPARRVAAGERLPGSARALLHLLARAPALTSLYARGRIDPECSAGETGFRFGVAHPVDGDVLLAGDAAALPHPVGGDGIAMALRAGRLAAASAAAFLDGRVGSVQLPRLYAREWRREFAPRLRWCAALHAILVRPAVVAPVVHLLAAWPAGMRFAVERTRGRSLENGRSLETGGVWSCD